MNIELTPKQKIVLTAISQLTKKNGTTPTLEELRSYLGYSHTSSVQRHTDILKRKGYLNQTRSISASSLAEVVQIPLVGNFACGKPLLVSENIEAYIPYDSSNLSGNSEDFFFLRAVGDSMNKANVKGKNIDDGDYVLVKKAVAADFGSKIVALIGDEATIKKMVRGDGCIKLEPETDNFSNKPILLFEDFMIQGVVYDIIKQVRG